ncbi:MAG: carbohydrate ABC transporter permease [Brevinematales bacterium]
MFGKRMKGWKWSDYKSYFLEKTAPYVLLSPFLFTLFVFFGYAVIRTFYYSFTNYNLFDEPSFIGLANYINIFKQSNFLLALRNSLVFSVVVTFVQTAGALFLALLMNQKIKGIRIFRTLYYMPSVTSSVVITLIFLWMFQRQGIINYILTFFKVYNYYLLLFFAVFVIGYFVFYLFLQSVEERVPSYGDSRLFVVGFFVSVVVTVGAAFLKLLPLVETTPVDIIWINTRELLLGFIPRPLFAVMCLNIWTTIPTMSLLYLAGLQDIPQELYEAAEVDGATAVQKFWYITLPQLARVTFLVMTLGFIGTLQMFDQVAVIGNAAPLESIITLAYYVYTNVFSSSGVANVGLAAAAAFILGFLTLIVVFIQKRFYRD